MCQFDDFQLRGTEWDASNNPRQLEVVVRATNCAQVTFQVFRTPNDTIPTYSASDRPVSATGVAAGTIGLAATDVVRCDDLFWLEVHCATDAACAPVRKQVRVICKGLERTGWPCVLVVAVVALGMIGAFLGIIGMAVSAGATLVVRVLVAAAVLILLAGSVMLLICQPSLCRRLRIICWALKWATLLGMLLALATGSAGAVLIVLIYGMFAAGYVWFLTFRGCPEPGLLSIP